MNQLWILAFLGILIHFLMTILKRKNKNIPFSISYILTDSYNWVRLALAVSSTIAILLMSDDVTKIIHIKISEYIPTKQIMAFFAGYFNHSLIKRLVGFWYKESK